MRVTLEIKPEFEWNDRWSGPVENFHIWVENPIELIKIVTSFLTHVSVEWAYMSVEPTPKWTRTHYIRASVVRAAANRRCYAYVYQ